MEYKGYLGGIQYDEKQGFHGEVLHVKDAIHYSGSDVVELEKEFQKSVDDYLDFCKERGEEPEKPRYMNPRISRPVNK